MRAVAITCAAGTIACGGSPNQTLAPPEHLAERQSPSPVWPHAARLGELVTVGEYFSSEHFGTPHAVTVRVSPPSCEAYVQLVAGSHLKTGALIASEHRTPDGQPKASLVMVKRLDGWEFVVLDSSHHRLDVDPQRCARCHAEGQADHLFGLPHEPAATPCRTTGQTIKEGRGPIPPNGGSYPKPGSRGK